MGFTFILLRTPKLRKNSNMRTLEEASTKLPEKDMPSTQVNTKFPQADPGEDELLIPNYKCTRKRSQ